MDRFFFGVWKAGEAGHRLHAPGGSCSNRYEHALPFAYFILDGSLLSARYAGGEQPEGVVRTVVIAGWTILTFWDRSGDSRGMSNSAFVMKGRFPDFAAAVAAAKESFPEVFARFPFELTPEPD